MWRILEYPTFTNCLPLVFFYFSTPKAFGYACWCRFLIICSKIMFIVYLCTLFMSVIPVIPMRMYCYVTKMKEIRARPSKRKRNFYWRRIFTHFIKAFYLFYFFIFKSFVTNNPFFKQLCFFPWFCIDEMNTLEHFIDFHQ